MRCSLPKPKYIAEERSIDYSTIPEQPEIEEEEEIEDEAYAKMENSVEKTEEEEVEVAQPEPTPTLSFLIPEKELSRSQEV